MSNKIWRIWYEFFYMQEKEDIIKHNCDSTDDNKIKGGNY